MIGDGISLCSMFNVQSSMFYVQCSKFNVQSSMFNSIELFPLTPWRRSASQQGVGEGVVGELLGARIEEELCVQSLCDDTETEHLRSSLGGCWGFSELPAGVSPFRGRVRWE